MLNVETNKKPTSQKHTLIGVPLPYHDFSFEKMSGQGNVMFEHDIDRNLRWCGDEEDRFRDLNMGKRERAEERPGKQVAPAL